MMLTGFVMMIVVTLLYAGELGGSTLLKFWGVFLLVVAFNTFILYIPVISPLLQWGIAAAMYIRARFNPALD